MFINRTSRFRLSKVLAIVHVFLACVLLPLAVADDRSATLADNSGSVRRSPAISFKTVERSNNGGLHMGSHATSHRRSNRHGVNANENHGTRRVPDSFRRRTRYRPAYVNDNHNRNENTNLNVNYFGGIHKSDYTDEIPSIEIEQRVKKANDDRAVDKLEAKLHSCVTLRANIIKIFGQILKAPNNILTLDQFESLNLILQAVIHKRVYTFNLIPILKKLQGASKENQIKLVMQALVHNVPPYMTSACKFWLNEIQKKQVNIEALISRIEKPHDILTGIDPEVIDTCRVRAAADELEPFDKTSEVIKKTLGPVFVNIFNKLKNHQITLSQKLFGIILMNLPMGKLNPVLEEYINYIWDVMRDGLISNWNDVAREIEYGSPYALVNNVFKKFLSKADTPDVLKHAMKYVLTHLKEVPSSFSDEYYPDMEMLLNDDKNLELMFSMIHDDPAIPELADLRDRTIDCIKDTNIDNVLQGMNKYTYQKPIDVLIALLARLQGRMQKKEIRDTVAKLLTVLISKKELDSFTLKVPGDVDLMMLLDFLKVPDGNPAIPALGQKIQHYLQGDLNLSSNLQDLLLNQDKSKCHRPIQCLLNLFAEVGNPVTQQQLGIPDALSMMIEELADLMENAINTSAKCASYDAMSVERPEISDDSFNVALQPVAEAPALISQPGLPVLLNSTEKYTQEPTPPLMSIDNDGIIFKPESINPHGSETLDIVYPAYAVDKVADLSHPAVPVKDVVYPDGWGVKPMQVETPEVKPLPILIPKGKPRPIPTVPPTPIPQIIQTFKPPVAPVKPTIGPSIILPETSPVPTTPHPVQPTKLPAKNQPNNSSLKGDNEPVLPPNLKYDEPMYVVFPKGDAPLYTVPTMPVNIPDLDAFIEFPSIKELLQGLDPNRPFHADELPDMPGIFEPLKQTLGPNFVEEILGKRVDKAEYPTVISLMDDVLDHALDHPKVKRNKHLYLTIQRYLRGIDYISTTALFPLVVDSQKIPSDVVYVTFDPDDPNANSVDSDAPDRIPSGFMTLPVYHPKYLAQRVDPLNPYGTLLPNTDEGEDNPIQELINDGSLREILGPDFDPLLYPNKGTLLTTVLHKLMVSKRVKSDPWLLKTLNAYLKSIRSVAQYSRIPKEYDTHLLELQENNEVNWQPETASLIAALPPARNQHEERYIDLVKSFLEMPNLLELLHINNPPYSITRGELLKMIFSAAIRGKNMVLDPHILDALKYYESKILTTGSGALPIIWSWVEMFVIHEEVALGDIIESVIDYDSLPRELRLSYNDLMTYLSENPELLQGNEDFDFEQFVTKGTFLKGLFAHLLTEPTVNPNAKILMSQLIPYIKLDGHGAEPMNHVSIDDIANDEIDVNRFSHLL